MKPKLLLITPRKYAKTTEMIIEEAGQLFDLIVAPIDDIIICIDNKRLKLEYEGRDITKVDYVLPKIDSKRAVYGFEIINAFDAFPVPKPYHAATILVAHDKFLTSIVLAHSNIPVPKTYIVKTKKAFESIRSNIKYPLMAKLKGGSGGQGIMYVENKESMESIISSMEVLKEEILIQEFIENPGEDIRVLVAGDTVIGSMKRIAKEGEKRANVKAGGTPAKYTATDEIKDISIRAAKAVGADICAVDLIESSKGPVVIEVNINPGLVGLTAATNFNIAKRIVEYVYDVTTGRYKH
ncbi:MAG: RimK family alpha-L-glutamate ligase [Candidatus Aenigmarchaeota archaeon]|nr:RimK family alpha-L-glutamate ligase [Candidatus Aenigmarchaeota archaeon]